MTTDIFGFYLQNRLIQTSQTVVKGTVVLSPLVFPGELVTNHMGGVGFSKVFKTNQFGLVYEHSLLKILVSLSVSFTHMLSHQFCQGQECHAD
jgi:hypothetical protein